MHSWTWLQDADEPFGWFRGTFVLRSDGVLLCHSACAAGSGSGWWIFDRFAEGTDLETVIAVVAEKGYEYLVDVDAAQAFARERHRGQLRKGTRVRYIVHPQRVAKALARHYPSDTALTAAGWLHDTLEDTATTAEELEQAFGPKVRRLVQAVTKGEDGAFQMPSDPDAVRLKTADALDNVTFTLRGLRRGEPVFERFKAGYCKYDYWLAIARAARGALGDEPLVVELDGSLAKVGVFVPSDRDCSDSGMLAPR
ncbi:MAG: HD domain-containing protein [Chloroflexota bacterium]